METNVTRELVPEAQRSDHVGQLFGVHFPMQLEPVIYDITSSMATEYKGGYWDFYKLSTAGSTWRRTRRSHSACHARTTTPGRSPGMRSGIVACLYAYSHLSFSRNEKIGRMYARHYHLLREYMMEHPEVAEILGAID
jgi:hypothetical protein